jgi:hypothetical protein
LRGNGYPSTGVQVQAAAPVGNREVWIRGRSPQIISAMAAAQSDEDDVDYEAQRAANIARNEAFMKSVGIVDAVAEAKAAKEALRKKRVPRAKAAASSEPARASKRNEGKKVSYTYDQSDRALGLSRESRARGPGTVDWDNISCEDPAKSRAAAERAEAFEAASTLPSCVKVLLKSHVSGGFWLQLPSAFCASMPQNMDLHPLVKFDLHGRSGDGLPEEVPDDDAWEVIWLRKGSNGGGLSGGWRGFSIDNNLAAGDTIVFEKLDGHFLRGTIFRAIALADNEQYCSRPADQVAKVAAEVAAAKAAGLKRRYATITIRENAFRRAHVEGVPYKKGSAKKKKVKKELVEEEEEPAEYVVEKLVDTRRARGTREYHVKWYGFDDMADYTWETEKNLNGRPESYEGYAENVEPKLSKKEKDQARANKAEPAKATEKTKSKTKTTKKKSKAAGGAKATAEAEEAEEPAQRGRSGKRKRGADASANGNTPQVGDRVRVQFMDDWYVGSVITKLRQKRNSKPKVQEFEVHFDADDEKMWIALTGPWAFESA